MKKIILVVGTRPNFIKAYPVYKVLKDDYNVILIHTGQHYDNNMSQIFFDQLKFPRPDKFLMTSRKNPASQLGDIIYQLEIEFTSLHPDLVIVFGDVTSTLAAALTAKKLNIRLAHVESGLRSNDLTMPEEVNRIVTDFISNYHFVTEPSGIKNLKNEGLTKNIYHIGNTMIDTQKQFIPGAIATQFWKNIGILNEDTYVLVTLHRPSNVDDLEKLREIFNDLFKLSGNIKLVYPIHPRTLSNLRRIKYLDKIKKNKNIILTEPLGYLEFMVLMLRSDCVITDSGGVQEETTALKVACYTLRENTERPITLIENGGTNKLISSITEVDIKCSNYKKINDIELWDGNASKRLKKIIDNII